MKVSHWVMLCGSGMHRVAESMAKAEVDLGLESAVVDVEAPTTWDVAEDSDIHVVHTHFPSVMNKRLKRGHRLVWVGHGTPDHVFHSAAESAQAPGYGQGDALMLMLHWLQVCHARVTFWDRHKWIYDRMLSRGARPADCIPLGVDLSFWNDGGKSLGKFVGEPSVFTAENPHYIKWPYDLFTAWSDVTDAHPDARLHAIYVPRDMHRVFIPWANSIGSAYGSYISPAVFDKEWLRNAFRSTDYTLGLVRYGDMNHLSQQANAAGATTISYAGNPYSDYWIPEGDQRNIASELIAILKGDRTPRQKTPVPDITSTAQAMKAVYEAVL